MLPYHLDAAKQTAGRAGAAARRRDGRAGCKTIVAERERLVERRAVRRSTVDVVPERRQLRAVPARRRATTPARCGRASSTRRADPRLLGRGRASTGACASPSGTPTENDRFLAALGGGARHRRHDVGHAQPRATKETSIEVSIDLDGSGAPSARPASRSTTTCSTSSVATAASISPCKATGDLAHRHPPHGRGRRHHASARRSARRSATRPASAASPAGCIPLDEALVEVALDLSGRPFVAWDVELPEIAAARQPGVRPPARRARRVVVRHERRHHAARHLRAGRNVHHIIEATFKGLARCLRDAVRVESTGRSRRPRACCDGRRRSRDGAGRRRRLRHRQPPLGAQGTAAPSGADARLTADVGLIATPIAVVLPGVGAFGACMDALRAAGLEEPVLDAVASGRPFLGICVGMQMLFDASEEDARRRGLGVIPGTVRWIAPDVKRPQMQWNRGRRSIGPPTIRCSPAWASEPWFYFVHSLHGVSRRPGRRRRDVRLRRPGQRRVPVRQRVRGAVPPGEVRRRPGSACSANFVGSLAVVAA